jgi:hypothetical protein
MHVIIIGNGFNAKLAFGTEKNERGNYQYAYTGLGPLTGFVPLRSEYCRSDLEYR